MLWAARPKFVFEEELPWEFPGKWCWPLPWGCVLLVPMRFLWRMVAGGVLGALVLMVLNFFSPVTGLSIAVNPFTALTVGVLGLPGALLVGVLSYYLL